MSDLANKQVHPPLFKVGDVAKTEAGLTLREHFAGLALQGLLQGHFAHYGHDNFWAPHAVADHAIECADALIAELSKGGDA